MKHRYGIIATLVSCMLLPISLQAADAPPATKAAEKTAEVPKAKSDKVKKEVAVSCDSIAGSRIGKSRADCDRTNTDPAVRDISADEINGTGEMNTSEALRRLDPRLN